MLGMRRQQGSGSATHHVKKHDPEPFIHGAILPGSWRKEKAIIHQRVWARTAPRPPDHGGTRVYIGGSFVTAKAEPGDWDGCVDSEALDVDQLSDAILTKNRTRMHEFYCGELFLNTANDDYLSYFQSTRHGSIVGIVALTMTEEDFR